jgi:hypothetical protein
LHPLPTTIAAIALALVTVEGLAFWWMHPTAAGSGEPVLVYRPGAGEQLADGPPSANRPLPTANSTLTPLPEIYTASAPMLRCSGGQVLHARLDDSSGIHLAFFEWDGTDTGSVLEAFRHMPEACMGSIGLKLVEKAPSRTYVVGGQGLGARGQESGIRRERSDMDRSYSRLASQGDRRGAGSNQRSEIGDQEEAIAQGSSSISTSNIENSKLAPQSLLFDHTVFREGGGHAALSTPIHAFRAVWVSGVPAADARKGLGGDEFDRLRTIRLKSAMDRFRPAHARVIQGAVRGIADPDLAWQAFESTMLKDLSFTILDRHPSP